MKNNSEDKNTGDEFSELSPEEAQRLIRELRVRQAELEMENEELRRQAKEAMAEQRQKLADIIRNTNVGTWEWNVHTGETKFNERWAEIIGYALEEISPVSIDTWIKFTHPDDLRLSGELLEKHFNGESDYYECEARMRHKNGDWVWILDTGRVATWTEDGKPLMMSGIHQDVTSRKLAEDSLRQNRDQFESILSNIQCITYRCAPDKDWTMTYMSPHVDQLTGYPPGDFVNNAVRTYESIIHQEDTEYVDQSVNEAIKSGKPWEIEYRICHRDGGIRWVYEKGSGVPRPDGSVEHLDGFIINISERMQAQDALRESERKYKDLIENSPMAVIQSSADGRILFANQKIAEIFGYKDAREFVSEHDPSEAYLGKQRSDMLAKIRKDGFFTNREQQFLTKNGGSVWLLITSFLDRETDIITSVGVDITNWKKSEKEKERLLNIIEKAPYFVGWADAEGKAQYINPAGLKMTGMTGKDDYVGKPLDVFHAEKVIPIFQNAGVPCIIKDGLWEGESEVVSYGGRITPVAQTVIAHYDGYGNLKYLSTIIRDITDIKKNEHELKRTSAELSKHRQNLEAIVSRRTEDLRIANAELEQANRLKDEFLANMSHELRTPLTAVLGMSEALLEQAYGPLNEKQIRSLQRIESSGRHLLSLINDILDLSKISAGKMELEISRVSVEAVCQSGLKMIKQIALKKNQKLSLSTNSGPGHIRADMLRLKQMLVNLLMNAVKFTPKRGEISLEVTCVPERDTVEFAVRDTGVGISRENMEKLFKPFVQLDGGLSREHEGTGLGLALVSRLAEMHGGSVSVESEEGKYSRFAVMLPWYPEEEEQEEKEDLRGFENLVGLDKVGLDKVGLDKGPARILMADDNMLNIETVAGYLKAKSYSVLLAYDGSSAVALTIEKKPDLIIMDIQMPGMNGLEAIKAIRKLEKDEDSGIRRIPIIALTALAMPGDREQCIEAGADRYMSKPVGLKQLAGMIEELLAV
ncbi:PAS domain-containing protein [Desulfobacterales bacterium HSG2]|nr:PAS domain-containing protein [Desulfobacterales bacterium HSG2]